MVIAWSTPWLQLIVLPSFNFFVCNAETWTRLDALGRQYLLV